MKKENLQKNILSQLQKKPKDFKVPSSINHSDIIGAMNGICDELEKIGLLNYHHQGVECGQHIFWVVWEI